MVPLRVLLPIYEVLLRLNFERIALDCGFAVRCRAQSDSLGTQCSRLDVFIVRDVIDRGEKRHLR